MVLSEALLQAATRFGTRTALIFEDQKHSFSDIHRESLRVAGLLIERGLKRGDRVALFLENRPEYLYAYFAVAAAGGVLVPLNTFLAEPELQQILKDCRASMLVTSGTALPGIGKAIESTPSLRQVLLVEDLAAGTNSMTAPRMVDVEPGKPDDTAVLIYTSGTTGKPKAVMLSHRNLLSNAAACTQAVGVTPRDRILFFLPAFHSFTQMVCILAPVVAGMSVVMCPRLDRARIKRTVLKHRPTIFPAVPAVFTAMAQAPLGRMARWLNPVRIYISGGAPLPLSTLESFESKYGRPLCEGYGLSEASPVVALNPPFGKRKAGSVGLPLPGLEIRIVDETGRELPTGETGELLVSGPSIMKGYAGQQEETSKVLTQGWLHTGDLARRDEEGYIFIVGRIKEMLISRGMNIYPREIEEVLEAHPTIKEAAVIGLPDAGRGEVPFAFVVPKEGMGISESELKDACAARLARYKVPRGFKIVPMLPRNPAGKVLKQELKEQAGVTPRVEKGRGGQGDRVPRPEK